MSIQVLSEQLASQIAAGEVVERPYSVVKELVENALDAGATTINVDIQNAGRRTIQIADDGCGIPAVEIETAFLRHATSKLQAIDDLNNIRSLGFRGEALAAIAAVSQLTIVSRAAAEAAGIRLQLAGGELAARETVGAPTGTVISVENLFYNVPARLKFLKSDATEKRLIDELVTRYALAYPAVRFRLTHNGRVTFQTNGSGSVLDVMVVIYGPEIARQLQAVIPETDGKGGEAAQAITVSGFIGPPSVHWANRSHIVLFVNGRWIKDNKLTYAVIQAYHTLLPSGRYPLAILFLKLPPARVDVNVHPTKTEVRFRGDRAPFGVVQRAVRQTLLADAPTRQMSAWALGSQLEAMTPGWEGYLNNDAFRQRDAEQPSMELSWSDGGEEAAQNGAGEGDRLPIMRVVGQVGAAYIISEGPDGLFLIDQRAAHERILFEQFWGQWQGGQVETKTLSVGTAVTLSPPQADWLLEKISLFAGIGFQIEPFGPQTVMVRGVPALVSAQDAAQLLLAMVTRSEREKPDGDMVRHLIEIVAETAAIRAGQSLTDEQMTALVQQLERCQDPLTTLQGQPTFIYLSVAQLAREFGRI